MWYDDPFVKFKKGRTNRKRRSGRGPILMVNAKVAQQRREHMMRLGTVVLCLVAVIGVMGVVFFGGRLALQKLFSENPKYTIRKLDVRSDGSNLPDQLILEYARVERDANLFAVDLAEVRESLLEVWPVEDVLVRRILPNQLMIHVTERVPVARFGPDSLPYPMAIDRNGVVLGRGARSPHLPLVTGPGTNSYRPGQAAAEQPIRDALRTLEIVEHSHGLTSLIPIDRIDVGNPRYLLLYLKGGQKVQLGRENMEAKLRKTATWIQNADETGTTWRQLNATTDEAFAFL